MAGDSLDELLVNELNVTVWEVDRCVAAGGDVVVVVGPDGEAGGETGGFGVVGLLAIVVVVVGVGLEPPPPVAGGLDEPPSV